MLWYSLVVFLTLVVFQVVSVHVIRLSLYRDLDQSLQAEAAWVLSVLDTYKVRRIPDHEIKADLTARSSLNPRKEFIEIFDSHGELYFRSPNLEYDVLQQLLADAGSQPRTIKTFRGHPLRLHVAQNDAYTVYVGYPLGEVEAAIDEIFSTSLLLIPITLLLIVLGGLFLVSRFTKPLDDLNRYADRLLQAPLEEELPKITVPSRDEIGNLVIKINQVVEQMRDTMRQVLSFSSLASHELRTPLAIMRSQLEDALQPQKTADELRQTAASLHDEVLRMNHIVDELLSLATMQAGTFKITREPVALRALLEEFYEEARMLAEEKRLTVQFEPGPPVDILADVVHLRQVLFNLLDNAIKHTPEGGAIRFGYTVQNQHVRFCFVDTGSGISPSRLARIRSLFDGKAERYGLPGAGLGLAITRWIVAKHDAHIAVDSEPGRGTTFTITLPVILSSSSTIN